MAARVLSCAFWLQRLSLLRWFTITMAQHVFACATHRSLLDGISGLRLPDTAVYPRFSLLRTSREAGEYACTSAPAGWGLHPHEDGVTRLCSLAACLEVRTSFQPTGHSPDLVVKSQAIDIIGLISSLIRRKPSSTTSRRPRKSSFELLSLSEGHWFTT
jgi:hypothetical protein